MTRPEFLMKFIATPDGELLPIEHLKQILPDKHPQLYCAYDVLTCVEVDQEYTPQIDVVEGQISAKFPSPSVPKYICESYDNEVITMGRKTYKVELSCKGKYLFIDCDQVFDTEE